MGKNKLNFGLLIGIVLVLALSMIGLTNAATGTVSLDLPADGTTVSGTFILNVTNTTILFDQMHNCTFTLASTLTANTSVTIGTFDNDTITNVNATYDSTLVEDGDDYVLTANCVNSSKDTATDTATITIDNTIPQAATGLTPTTDEDGSFTFSGTVVGANTTSCTLLFDGQNPGSSSYAMTHSANTCSYIATNIPAQTYDWYIRASDETNTTDSSTQTTNIDTRTSSGKFALLQEEQQTTTSSALALGGEGLGGNIGGIPIIVIILLVGVLVVVVIAKRKK